ncbi:MAG: ATP-binding protein [Polyangiales bacterium]
MTIDALHDWLFPPTRVHVERTSRWLPPGHPTVGLEAGRMDMFVRNVVGLVQVMVPTSALFLVTGKWSHLAAVLGLIALAEATLFLNRSGRLVAAKSLFLSGLLLTIGVAAWCAKGHFLSTWIWAPTIPITALCTSGTREGMRWLVRSVFVALVVLALRALGIEPPLDFQASFGGVSDVATGVGALISIVGIAGTYENNFRMLLEDAAVRNRELESARADLEARNRSLSEAQERLERLNADLATARDAAEAGARARSEFVAVISHEIRTPMNAVIGMTSLLQDTGLAATQQEYVDTIRASGEALLTLLNDTLDYSKLDAGRVELESLAFEPRVEARVVVEMMRGAAQARGNVLTLNVEESMPRALRSDPGRIRQVLLNLVSNAVKFTSHGAIDVDLALEGADTRWLRVSVRDTGIGIAPEKLSTVFDAFTQADASTTRRFGGTGLGLAISRRLATILGGTLTVESTLGRGATFTLRVPVEPAQVSDAERVDAPSAEAPAASARVLVAEDNAVNQKVITLMLKRLGHRVDAVANGAEALEALSRAPYDLVLMDVQMPEMDGLEATRQLRARGDRVRVVALTANVSGDDRARCTAAGMDDFLSKPVREAALAAVMRHRSAP